MTKRPSDSVLYHQSKIRVIDDTNSFTTFLKNLEFDQVYINNVEYQEYIGDHDFHQNNIKSILDEQLTLVDLNDDAFYIETSFCGYLVLLEFIVKK